MAKRQTMVSRQRPSPTASQTRWRLWSIAMVKDPLIKLESEYFRTLANPKRLQILYLLHKRELPVNKIAKTLGFPQANISQHLMVLRKARLLVTRKNGKKKYYRLYSNDVIRITDMMKREVNRLAGRV